MRTNKLTAAVLISDAALGTRLAACGGSSGSQTYQATEGTLYGGAVIQSDSGTEVVGWIGEGGTLTFPDVTVPSNGSYPVTIGYANVTGDRQAVIAFNRVTLPGERGGRGSVDQVPAKVLPLHAAPNTFTIGNPTAYAPDITAITVSNG
jgi:hypothetical protein